VGFELDDMVCPSKPLLNSTEKMLLESFVYNYSIALLQYNPSNESMTSPFQIMEEFRPFLNQKLYDCPAPWMNNPVVGASLSVIEIAAKCNWLRLQMPLDESNTQLAMRLLNSAKYYV
ncbi:hypothetical protein WICPIJ_000408, partial [Wickerhamomyces pijperi]